MKNDSKLIESRVLANEYKTIRSYKAALTRYENEIKADFQDVKEWIDQGHNLYLGEPAIQRYNVLKRELEDIQIERRKTIEANA